MTSSSTDRPTILITGGTSGIGWALALEYGSRGWNVALTGRDPQRLARADQELSVEGIPHLCLGADAAIEEDNRQMIERTIDEFHRLDALVANAGISQRALFEETQSDVFQTIMDINFNGLVFAARFALPHLLASQGSLIGISSVNGLRATPGRVAYSASKSAMLGFLEALRTEVMGRGVHVLAVCPGFTASNIRYASLTSDGKAQGYTPRNERKMMSAETVARAIYRAHERRQRDLVLTIQGRLAVWLNKWFPGLMDQIVVRHMEKEPGHPGK